MIWRKFAVVAALTICGSAAAQQNSLVGEWRGAAAVNGATLLVDLVVGANGQYSEELQLGGMMTTDSGTIQLLPGNEVHFTVVDWQPKQQCLAPTGCHPILKPPGATYRVEFTSATTMVFQDINLGGVIDYERIR